MTMIDIGMLIVRVIIGPTFFGHGTQKLFGWFGGNGIAGTEQMMASMEVAPIKFWAYVVGLSEALGGLGLLFGFLTPLAAAAIVGVMLVAIIRVHWKNGFWNTNRGIEFPLLNLGVALMLGLAGPGLLSIDALFGFRYSDPVTFMIALVIAVLGVIISLVSGEMIAQFEYHQKQMNG
jgi:putative oxidoreductase